MDINKLVESAISRSHRTICTNLDDCSGPTEMELLITSMVLQSTLPKILDRVSLELRQALHSAGAGHMIPGDPDALAVDPDELLRDWLSWWQAQPTLGADYESKVHVRTAAYLAARAVQAR